MTEHDDLDQLSISAAAAFLGVHVNTIRWYADAGRLAVVPRVITPNGVRMFYKRDLRRLDDERKGLRMQRWDLWTVRPNMLRMTESRTRSPAANEQRSATGGGRK